ncbi:MAG: SpoIIE family protein phosphatase [Clostridia bacterium]|nr:SpoIIE family protein phosphatase [Clostridia bacterium]
MKQGKVNKTDILQYIVFFLLMILTSMASNRGVRPFAIGVFVGLAYCKKNVWLLAPMLLAAALIGEFGWQSILLAATAVIVVTAAYYLHYLFKKRMKAWQLIVYAFVSQTPVLLVYGINEERLLLGALSLVLSTAFAYCCTVLAHCAFVKGVRYKMTAKEELCMGFLAAVLTMGMVRISLYGVVVGMVVMGFAYLLAPRVLREKGVFAVMAMGLGAWAATGDAAHIAVAAVMGLGAYVLRNQHPVFALAVLTATDFACGFLLKLYADYYFVNTILFALGGGILACIPNKIRNRWEGFLQSENDIGVRYLVNRNRLDLYGKLVGVAGVLTDMRLVLEGGICNLAPIEQSKNQLAKELAKACCAGCAYRPKCERALSSSTAVAMYDLIARALDTGRLSILETPSFFGENCPYQKRVVETCGDLLDGYIRKKQVADRVDDNKRVMCEQLSGLSGMMNDLAAEVKQVVSFDTTKEKRLLEDLSNGNIIAKECIIYRDKGLATAILVVRAGDQDKPALDAILEKHLGKMVVKSVSNHSSGWVSKRYVTAPPLGVATGTSTATKKGSERSGDTFSVLPLGTDKTLLAVCDGMGSGEEASGGANAAMSLVESFYTAGIDDEAVLSLINKLLVVRNEDSFQALDICVVDLRRKQADFIKLGAPESVIRRADRIETVEGGALPIGILENVTPKISRVKITEGDMIVMCSDGITESIGVEGVVRMIEQNPTVNPNTMARLVVEDALFVNESDDKTVLCARIFDNV